ncbi:hypothetical protein ACFYKX_20225 [Cytobacillus sp. FJAT-54145]|uniref:Aminoglycoside phosphotransferase domain-containing protein n=1 Tax=Cytobacillus spartinae TaxID=3299023 RepID=A0ABW6KJ98_9BACI
MDFDDCCSHWYVADIAYALRDILEDGVNWENPSLQQFLNGYEQRMELDKEILKELPWFLRMHNLVTFAKLLRTVDLEESRDYPEWLSGLHKKLLDKLDDYRVSFKK